MPSYHVPENILIFSGEDATTVSEIAIRISIG